MGVDNFSDLELDQLAEMTNIGAGNAATALSHMLGKEVQMTVPESFVGDIDKIQAKFGEVNDTVVAIFLKIKGDMSGAMLIIFPKKDAVNFVNLLNNKKVKKVEDFDETDKSSLLEVGNILLGSSITALGKFMNINIRHTIPDIAIDMLGAIMDTFWLEMADENGQVLTFKINLHFKDSKSGGDLYYLFDPNSSSKILKANKDKING